MINLLPYKEKKAIVRIRFIRLVRTIIVGFVFLCIISGFLLFPTLVTVDSRFNIVSNQISSLEHDGKIASSFDLTSVEKRVASVQSKLAQPSGVQPTDYVEMVRTLIPSGVTVDRFAMNDSLILEVSGIVDTRATLEAFIKALEADPHVSSVDNPVSNFVKSKNSMFNLKVAFK